MHGRAPFWKRRLVGRAPSAYDGNVRSAQRVSKLAERDDQKVALPCCVCRAAAFVDRITSATNVAHIRRAKMERSRTGMDLLKDRGSLGESRPHQAGSPRSNLSASWVKWSRSASIPLTVAARSSAVSFKLASGVSAIVTSKSEKRYPGVLLLVRD